MEESWTLINKNYKHACYATTSSSHLPPIFTPTSNKYAVLAKGDSAASKHYFTKKDKHVLVKLRFDPEGPTVLLPNSAFMTSTETGELPISDLGSSFSKKTAVFDDLHSCQNGLCWPALVVPFPGVGLLTSMPSIFDSSASILQHSVV